MKVYEPIEPGFRHVIEHKGGTAIYVRLQRRRFPFFWDTLATEIVRTTKWGQLRSLHAIDLDVEAAKVETLHRSNEVCSAIAYVTERQMRNFKEQLEKV